MKNSDWNNLRAKLHHDWLQNRYLTFLKSWKECFDNVSACGPARNEVIEQLLQWKGKRETFINLFDGAENALSPRQLLYEPPLNHMSNENRKWLGDVIHALYCARTGIKESVAILSDMVPEIDKVVDEVAMNLEIGEAKSLSAGKRVIFLFTDFSRKISELPHEIQIV